MADSIFIRVQRVLATGTNGAVDALERVSGGSLMRQAIREVDQSVDEVRSKLEKARARRDQAAGQQQSVRRDIATLEEQARFAMGKQREDLAEAAVARQIDYEAELERLKGAQAEAAVETRRLEECLAELKLRRSQMEKELAVFRAASGVAAAGVDAPLPTDAKARHRAERAEEAFNRAMAAAGGVRVGLMDSDSAEKIAEVDQLRREASIAERIAALRPTSPTAPKKKPPARKSK